jgi:hypothetical protein
MNKKLAYIVAGLTFSVLLLSLSLIATPSIVSKAYAQNSPGMLATKNASSSPSKFIGGAPLNQSGSNASSANNSSSTK